MKRFSQIAPLALAAGMLVLTGCRDKTIQKVTYTANTPLYMSFDEFRATEIKAESPKALTNPGKIYFYNQYIFVNDRYKGIHIINNSNPSSPQNIGYINIPGSIDMAIKDNILYADSRVDLVAIDINNPMQPVLKERMVDVFPNSYPVWDPNYPIQLPDPNEGVVIGWEIQEVTERRVMDQSSWNPNVVFMDQAFESGGFNGGIALGSTTTTTTSVSIGVSGSMARMVINDPYMYTVNDNILQVFDINNTEMPVYVGEINLNRTAETLSMMDDYLFVGTTTGMIVYNLANASSPEYTSTFAHSTMCDPVVAQGDYAYITLRGGSACGNWGDQLDVVNISNINQPYLESSYPMTEPYGLGIDGTALFVCDGDAGLKVYDATNPTSLVLIDQFNNINAYDVIPINNLLLMIGEDGLYQYDYASLNNLNLLSVIPIQTL